MRHYNLTMGEIRSRVSDLFATSRIQGMTSAEECDLLNRGLWGELGRRYANGRRVYSHYLAGYAMGLVDAHRADNYARHLEFCYLGADGTKYSTRKGAARSTEEFYAAGRGCELGSMPSGHFWIENGKPYFTGERV